MASQLPEQKLNRHLTDNCADSRLNEVAVANHMSRQSYDIQARFHNILIAYIYTMAHCYEVGMFHHNTYEIARICKKIKDFALYDEYTVSKYSDYGDYEVANDMVTDLTGYPMA